MSHVWRWFPWNIATFVWKRREWKGSRIIDLLLLLSFIAVRLLKKRWSSSKHNSIQFNSGSAAGIESAQDTNPLESIFCVSERIFSSHLILITSSYQPHTTSAAASNLPCTTRKMAPRALEPEIHYFTCILSSNSPGCPFNCTLAS